MKALIQPVGAGPEIPHSLKSSLQVTLVQDHTEKQKSVEIPPPLVVRSKLLKNEVKWL
jgi:hypothetical protein